MKTILCQLALLPGAGQTNATARAVFKETGQTLLVNSARLHRSPFVIGDLDEAAYIETLLLVIDAKAQLRQESPLEQRPVRETIEMHTFGIVMPLAMLELGNTGERPHEEIVIAISTVSYNAFAEMVTMFDDIAEHATSLNTWRDFLKDDVATSPVTKTLWTCFIGTCSKAIQRLLQHACN